MHLYHRYVPPRVVRAHRVRAHTVRGHFAATTRKNPLAKLDGISVLLGAVAAGVVGGGIYFATRSPAAATPSFAPAPAPVPGPGTTLPPAVTATAGKYFTGTLTFAPVSPNVTPPTFKDVPAAIAALGFDGGYVAQPDAQSFTVAGTYPSSGLAKTSGVVVGAAGIYTVTLSNILVSQA